MNLLTYGYAVISTLALIWFIVFPHLFDDNELRCREHPSFWTPTDEVAGLVAFIKSVLLIAPTIIIWLCFFYFRVPIKFNNASIRLMKNNETHSESAGFTRDMVDAYMMDASYNTNNAQNVSALTNNNVRKSAFTANHQVTQSFTKWDS